MALFKVSIPEITSAALDAQFAVVSASTKTLIQLAPASNKDFVITRVHISLDGTPANQLAAVQFFLMGQSTAGTGGASKTPVLVKGGGSTTAATTALTAATAWSAEPTYVDIRAVIGAVNPSSGLLTEQFPLGREPTALGGGNRIALLYRSPTLATLPNITAEIQFEE